MSDKPKMPDENLVGRIEQLTDSLGLANLKKDRGELDSEYMDKVKRENIENSRFEYLSNNLDQLTNMVIKIYLMLYQMASPEDIDAVENAMKNLKNKEVE